MNTTTSAATILDVYISEDKQSYYTLITMGNMSFRIALDTGSADLWVVSSACTSSGCSSLPRYQLGYKSLTFESVNDNQTLFNVSYADTTTVSGFVARETVLLNNLTVVNQAFGLINSSNVSLTNDISGVMGLSFSRLSTISDTVANATSIFGSMAQQGQLDYPLFGLSLKTNATGTLALGAIDATTVTNRSRIEWYEVVPFAPYNGTNGTAASYLQWVIELSNITVNGTNVTPQPTYSQSASNHSLALFDVGASGIYGPYQDVARIFDQISGARLVDASSGQWVVPCDLSETISFNFGESNFTLQPTDYLVGPVSDDPYYCLAWPAATAPSHDGIDWQLGTPFLQTVYSIYSFGIDTKEAPMMGLYALHNATELDESVADVSSYFSSASATVDTMLPNYLVSTPVYTTPAYIFNTSVSAPPGLIVSSGLATSTYSPVLGTAATVNASAIPTVDPSPTLFTYIVTVSSGVVSTSVSTASQATVTLGEPPGWSSGAATVHVPTRFVVLALSALLLVVAC
ncbi:acid protease [Laetiporus sulphureus 93-53]|uniref:Acid protease n=1 Tax=Laetiporus sulphureus 93-53 TaxID=1314785 RepID=A0A165EV09_9APHY|nr:acid protease [Laetiporus sulphureus 93-53]KZT07818.1 acid protease [Laetiporus sulphureus 93-53]